MRVANGSSSNLQQIKTCNTTNNQLKLSSTGGSYFYLFIKYLCICVCVCIVYLTLLKQANKKLRIKGLFAIVKCSDIAPSLSAIKQECDDYLNISDQ